MNLDNLINKRFTVPESQVRHFGPELADRRKRAKPQPDYSFKPRRKPQADTEPGVQPASNASKDPQS